MLVVLRCFELFVREKNEKQRDGKWEKCVGDVNDNVGG